MSDYSIENFWRSRLPSSRSATPTALAGWESEVSALPTFVEAPLSKSILYGDGADPATSPLILVSAAGAVGKSTLARQIASETGAVYIDLGKADPVGGNTLSGGLVKSRLLTDWESDSATVLIDGLDEARLRVTQDGFNAFIDDVAYLANERSTPTVLFGRTGAIQDAWLLLADKVPVTVLEIGYYTPDLANRFAMAQLRRRKPDYAFMDAADRAIELLLAGLREDVGGDGDRFAGYAPVLQAVAEQIALDPNPAALIAKIERGEQPVTLHTIIDAILKREQTKLAPLAFEDTSLKERLYDPGEQLARLATRVYAQPTPPIPPMSASDAETYANALETWVADHPFLDGARTPVSAVFDAVIAGIALCDARTADAAASRELAKGAAANPFLAEFYLAAQTEGYIRPEHVGIIYASLRARLSIGDEASLSIEGIESEDELEQLRAEIEITLVRAGSERPRVLSFDTEQTGVVRLGSFVEDVEVTAPHADLEIGGNPEAILVSPVTIQAKHLTIRAERLIVESQPHQATNAVSLQSDTADTTDVSSVPVSNGDVILTVNWQGDEAYPWTNFRSAPTIVQDPRTAEALRRFRKFVISFRSHSKGALKRFAGKLEHERMVKGTGSAVLEHMRSTGIVATDGSMYTLFPDKLAQMADTSYVAIMTRQFSEGTIAFVQDAIAGGD
ncbi:hypothetical protein [Alteriqipengyuania sp. 357]